MELSDVMETSPTAGTAVTAGAGHGEPGCLHRSAHAAADKGRAGCWGAEEAGRWPLLLRRGRRCPALSHHHHHQADTDITIYWSLLSVPSITEYKALQIQAWLLLICGHHRPDMVTLVNLTSTYLYPGPVQCPLYTVSSVHRVQPPGKISKL